MNSFPNQRLNYIAGEKRKKKRRALPGARIEMETEKASAEKTARLQDEWTERKGTSHRRQYLTPKKKKEKKKRPRSWTVKKKRTNHHRANQEKRGNLEFKKKPRSRVQEKTSTSRTGKTAFEGEEKEKKDAVSF